MSFSDLLDAVRDHPLAVTIPAEWAQARASFGGLMAALAIRGDARQGAGGSPGSLVGYHLCRPGRAGRADQFDVEVLREGKAVSQVLGRATQNGQVVTLVQGSFGASRASVIAVSVSRAANEALGRMPGVAVHQRRDAGVHAPHGDALEHRRFAVHRTSSWLNGRLCASARRRERRAAQRSASLALVDTWPPALLPYLRKPATGQHVDLDHRVRSAAARLEYVGLVLVSGSHRVCRRWLRSYRRRSCGRRKGELIAMSRQTVTIFA